MNYLKLLSIGIVVFIIFVGNINVSEAGSRIGRCPPGYIGHPVPFDPQYPRRPRFTCVPALKTTQGKIDFKKSQIESTKAEIKQFRSELEPVEKEVAELDRQLQSAHQQKSKKEDELKTAQSKWDATYQNIYDIQYIESPKKLSAAENLKTDTVGGLPLGKLKDGLNNTADRLDSIKGTLKNMGYKDEDIQKVINYVGVDPKHLADNIREVAKEVKPQMSYNDLVVYKAALQLRLNEAKADEEKMKNTAAKERAEIARYDADIAKANDEKRMHDENRKGHDKLADDYDGECKRDWPTCTWNIPKAVWERSMAALDQGHMNRVNTWIGILNFGKMFPGMVVAQSDLKAAPYTYTRQIIEKQIAEVDKAKTDLNTKINEELTKASQEEAAKLAPLQAQYKAEKKVVNDLKEDLKPINYKISENNAIRAEKEWTVKSLQETVTGREALLAQYETELAQLETQLAQEQGGEKSVASNSARSVQALADPQELQRQADTMKTEVTLAKNKAAVAKTQFNEWVKQSKREERVGDTSKKPLPMIRPVVAVDLDKKIEPQLSSFTQQENTERIQFQNRLETARLSNERELAQKKESLTRELEEKDREITELKKKADKAYADMMAALEKKKQAEEEALAKKKAQEEEAKQKALEEAMKQRQQEEEMKKQREIVNQEPVEEEPEVVEEEPQTPERVPAEQKASKCDPNVPTYMQRGCVREEEQQAPKEAQKCDPNIPRYSQPGCVD